MVNSRGFSDHMRRNRVYAADSADTSSHQSSAYTDDFTMATEEDEEELALGQIESLLHRTPRLVLLPMAFTGNGGLSPRPPPSERQDTRGMVAS